MGWFGGNDSDTGSSVGGGPAEKSFSSADMASSLDTTAAASSSFSQGGASEFQQFSMALQQQMLVQNVITELSDKAFQCVTACKNEQLTGKEVACIQAITNKWLDTNEFMMGRVQKKSQQQQQQHFG